MARSTPIKKNKSKYADRQCRECGHHYDECSPALDGHMILCHCPFYTDGKYCVFMKQPACDHFKEMN